MKNLKQIITPSNTLDHNYCHQFQKLSIDQQYADDIGWASKDKNEIQKLKKEAPPKLKRKSLGVNEGKTEEYEVRRDGPDDWKKAKKLGSMMETENDIKRGKSLALAT